MCYFKNKNSAIIVCMILILLLTTVTPAFAQVTAFVAKDSSGAYYEYNYTVLKQSYLDYKLGNTLGATLYNDFKNKTMAAYSDSVRGYVDYSSVITAYINARFNHSPFNLDTFTETSAALASMPNSVTQVRAQNGELIRTEKQVGNNNNDDLIVISIE